MTMKQINDSEAFSKSNY